MTEKEQLQVTIKQLESELHTARLQLYSFEQKERSEQEAAAQATREKAFTRLRILLNDEDYLRTKIAVLPFCEHNQFFGNDSRDKIDSLFFVTENGRKFYASNIWTGQDSRRLQDIIKNLRDVRKAQFSQE
jgi:hypothetical protein